MSDLKIGRGLRLPDDAITQTFAILAKRGVGKTYTASVMAEEMAQRGLPFVAVDPIGVWWGLRSSADGQVDGYPIVVFGGEHGDLPLEEGAGDIIADLVVDERVSCVLDLSLMRKGAAIRFMTAFAERLYHRNRDPLHLFLDESDAWAPQRTMRGQGAEQLLGAIEDLVRRGRARGIGVTLITQRPAVLNKNVLTQVETLVVHRIVSPQDRKAIDEWTAVHADRAEADEVTAGLATLEIGQAFWWSPAWLGLLKKVTTRKRRTFDSSSTPKAGQRRIDPKTIADVDLAALEKRIAGTVERAKANDPKALRRRVAELERELAAKPEHVEPERVEVEVEVEVMPEFVEGHVVDVEGIVRHVHESSQGALNALAELREHIAGVEVKRVPKVPVTEKKARSAWTSPPKITPTQVPMDPPKRTEPRTDNGEVTVPQQRVLDALAWFEAVGVPTPSRPALAPLAGSKHTSGGFKNNLGALRTAGLVDYPGPNRVQLTDAGRGTADVPLVEQTPDALQRSVLATLDNAKQKLLSYLIVEYPRAVSREELASQVGVPVTSGGFKNNLGRLRTLEMIDYPAPGMVVALPILFLE